MMLSRRCRRRKMSHSSTWGVNENGNSPSILPLSTFALISRSNKVLYCHYPYFIFVHFWYCASITWLPSVPFACIHYFFFICTIIDACRILVLYIVVILIVLEKHHFVSHDLACIMIELLIEKQEKNRRAVYTNDYCPYFRSKNSTWGLNFDLTSPVKLTPHREARRWWGLGFHSSGLTNSSFSISQASSS